MKTYARIENDVVIELFQTDDDITKLFHPDLQWEAIDNAEIVPGWRKTGAGFLPPMVFAPHPNEAIHAEIEAIEAAQAVPRIVREFMLVSAVDLAQRQAEKLTAAGKPTTADMVLKANVGYQRAKAADDQIKALRGRLT